MFLSKTPLKTLDALCTEQMPFCDIRLWCKGFSCDNYSMSIFKSLQVLCGLAGVLLFFSIYVLECCCVCRSLQLLRFSVITWSACGVRGKYGPVGDGFQPDLRKLRQWRSAHPTVSARNGAGRVHNHTHHQVHIPAALHGGSWHRDGRWGGLQGIAAWCTWVVSTKQWSQNLISCWNQPEPSPSGQLLAAFLTIGSATMAKDALFWTYVHSFECLS